MKEPLCKTEPENEVMLSLSSCWIALRGYDSSCTVS